MNDVWPCMNISHVFPRNEWIVNVTVEWQKFHFWAVSTHSFEDFNENKIKHMHEGFREYKWHCGDNFGRLRTLHMCKDIVRGFFFLNEVCHIVSCVWWLDSQKEVYMNI